MFGWKKTLKHDYVDQCNNSFHENHDSANVLISTCFWPLGHVSLKKDPSTALLNTSITGFVFHKMFLSSSFQFGEVPSFQVGFSANPSEHSRAPSIPPSLAGA